jgi:hypothetical protein
MRVALEKYRATFSCTEPFSMTTKVCPNRNCPAYAHFVFTVAMRCVLCRCDLMSSQRIAATALHPQRPASLSPINSKLHATR